MALINRYQGNSGRVTRYSEPGERQSAQQPERRRAPNGGAMTGRPMASPPPQRQTPQTQGVLSGLNDLGKLLPEKIGELEVEDFILLLILSLMYRESGDSDLLIIMGAMFLL